MLFELITGGAGSGKSACIEDKIEECLKLGKRAVVIVPERFSHIEERTLCARFGGLGLNLVEVTTFSKLSRRLAPNAEYLRPSGREMLVLKAAKENALAGDGVFEGAYERGGFVEQLSDTIGELKRNLITPEMLMSYEGKGLLGRKMTALAAIYQSYNRAFENGLRDPDENMAALAELIEEEGGFSDARIFIDGFSDFIPSHYRVIEALIKKADSVLVALTINDAGLRDPEGIFAPVAVSIGQLMSIADSCGATVKQSHLSGEYGYIKSGDIRAFLTDYDQYTSGGNHPRCENIKLDICQNRRDEIERVAGRIMYEVREKGLRFRDIGVIVGNADAYSHIIDAVFSEYEIPYFADNKMSASEHAVIRMVLCIFKIITENWSYQSVFEYLRSGFLYQKTDDGVVAIDQRKIDRLEIYCKSRGIRGKNVWLSEQDWKNTKKGIFDEVTDQRKNTEDISELDALRRTLMKPFADLMEKIRGRRKVKEFATALFEFLEDICLYEGLLKEQQRFEEKNMLDDAARIGEVWDTILETLDQCVITSGDEYMSREDFYRLLESGFSKCSIDTVPPSIDSVAVGRADMSRPVRVEALFVVGAIRGEMPLEQTDGGIITESDRVMLLSGGYDILKDNKTKARIAEFNLFSSLTAACERIYISYPEMNDEGSKATPCALVGELERYFGDIDTSYSKQTEWENILASGRNTYHKLISRVSRDISDEERDFWDGIWEYASSEDKQVEQSFNETAPDDADFSIFEELSDTREDILSCISGYKSAKTHIKPSTAAKLYQKRPFSITALQKFNECPFSYFAKYGLNLGEESEYKVKSSDIGKMVHWAVCEYCRKVQENAQTPEEKRECWEKLDEKKSKEIISALVENIARVSLESNPDFCEERLELMCKKAGNTITRSAKIIRDSLIAGGFTALEFEKPFRFTLERNGETVDIEGVIDRMDTADDESGKLLRIIDYKTGAQKFSVAGICNKTDLQLIIYALAAQDMFKDENARVSAVMYDKVRDELAKTIVDAPVAVSSAPLDGIIISDGENATAEELALHDRALLDDSAKSDFLPLQTKKAGGLKKNSTVISREKFNMLTRYVTKTAVETKNEVQNGNIAAYPSGDDEYSPCSWCEYSAICLHNKDKDGTRPKLTASVKAWEKIEMEDTNE